MEVHLAPLALSISISPLDYGTLMFDNVWCPQARTIEYCNGAMLHLANMKFKSVGNMHTKTIFKSMRLLCKSVSPYLMGGTLYRDPWA